MSDDLILKKEPGEITTITINKADIGNRVSDDRAGRLGGLINEASKDSLAIVLKSEGEDFCLGREVMGEKGRLKEAYETRNNFEVVFNLYDAFRQSPVPIVGAVQGGAVGFGCALAALCDITIAESSARFQLPEMGHHILPTMAMSALVDRVPRKALMYLVYSTEEINADQALIIGLISAIAPEGQLDAAVGGFLDALKKSPLLAVKGVKEYLRNAFNMDRQGATDFARNLHATINSSALMRP